MQRTSTMIHRLGGAVIGIGLIVGLIVGLASEANADPQRINTLSKDVAVRGRKLLVKNRFELAPLFESTVNADFRHIIGGGLKAEYHFSDILSVGIIGVASASINTGLVNKIVPTLGTSEGADQREPTQTQFLDHLNSMPFHGAAYISITPWYGKLAAFSQSYVAFDFYFQAGIAFADLSSNCPITVCTDTHPGTSIMQGTMTIPPVLNPNFDAPLNSGGRAGLYLGGGIHVYLNDFLGLDLTVRDYAFNDNPSGADVDANLYVDSKDSSFINHLFFGVGLSIMFPMTVVRTP